MTLHRVIGSLSLAILALGIALGQGRPATTSPAPRAATSGIAATAVNSSPEASSAATEPSPLKIHLMDGSLVTGKISVPDLSIETPFGTLKVPIESIRAFAPGLSSHPEFAKQLADWVNDLGADGFAERENAQRALLKLGSEIAPELRRQLKTAEAEKQTRLQKILEEFDSQHDSDEETAANPLDWTPDDVIVTNSFTIVGHITTPGFAVNNSYGTLQLKLADIRRAQRDAGGPDEIHKSIAVSGNLMTSHTFAAALKVTRGDKISITATGTITMTPWGGNMTSTPDGGGNGNFGTMQPGNIPGGALIARIGETTPFKVGSKHDFTAEKSGTLEFGIALPGNYGDTQFPGDYQVKIRIIRK